MTTLWQTTEGAENFLPRGRGNRPHCYYERRDQELRWRPAFVAASQRTIIFYPAAGGTAPTVIENAGRTDGRPLQRQSATGTGYRKTLSPNLGGEKCEFHQEIDAGFSRAPPAPWRAREFLTLTFGVNYERRDPSR